jgi:hypothetical protein
MMRKAKNSEFSSGIVNVVYGRVTRDLIGLMRWNEKDVEFIIIVNAQYEYGLVNSGLC